MLRLFSLVLVALTLVACGGSTPGSTTPSQSAGEAATPSPSPSALASGTAVATADAPKLLWRGPVEPGTYHIASSPWSVEDYTVTMPEGWATQYGYTFIKHSDQPGELGFYFVIVDAIYSDPCAGAGELVDVGPSVDDLAEALLEQPVTVAAEPVDTTLGGLPAKRIDLTVPEDLDPTACRMGEHLQIWYSPPADKYFVLLGDGTASVYILDVKGERQVLVAQYVAGTTPDDIREMQAIADSIRIDP